MSERFAFTIDATDGAARTGSIAMRRGTIRTPAFMPVGTAATIKAMTPDAVAQTGAQCILANTYHLMLRPGPERIERLGGLHTFMNWPGPILTDSGGYQVWSLADLKKMDEDGVEFRSHLDGSEHHFTPEKIVDIQRIIGSDFMMMLDVCPPGDADQQTWIDALNSTTNWAKRGMKHFRETEPIYGYQQALIPVVQGGTDKELRKRSTFELCELDADAYAIGGLAVGEPKSEMLETVEWMDEFLPKEKPRYLMGVGTPADLVRNVARGVDMFDCVMPTRNARNGQLFTFDGKMNIRNAKYKDDFSAIDDNGISPMSQNYSKTYLHHLFKTEEILGYRIATQHNLHFYIHLMKTMQDEIKAGNFKNWAKGFLERYEG